MVIFRDGKVKVRVRVIVKEKKFITVEAEYDKITKRKRLCLPFKGRHPFQREIEG